MKEKIWHVGLILVALGMIATLLPACASTGPGGDVVKAGEVKSDKSRLEAPSLDEARVPELIDGNTAFALDLYRQLFDQSHNLFYSPHSISLALAMTHAGARGNTERQMADALHFQLAQERLHGAFNALDQALASRGQEVEKDQRFQLNVANALWGQQDFAFLAAFLDTLAENYSAGMRLVDYQSAPEAARQTINEWVEQQTKSRIQNLLPAGSITPLTRLVLSNAIYFNAAWMHPFEESATKDGDFYLLDGETVTVPMMRQSERLGYYEGEGYQAVELPYIGGEMSMVILLPDASTFDAFALGMDAEQLREIVERIASQQVMLTMPRFEYDSGFELKKALMSLGMVEPFSMAADFSGMTGKPELFIDDVYHKAFVAVDEEGTEAAAATAVVMQLTAAPAMSVEVTVDRPFMFLIRDIETGAVLFLGHVVNPTA